MSKPPLSILEIKKVSILLRKVLRYIRKLKKNNPIAEVLENPKVPSRLSESLILNLLNQKLILRRELHGFAFNLGGGADISAKKDRKTLRLEVKGTGPRRFQKFGKKDIEAHYLIWVDFYDFFLSSKNPPVTLYIVKNPKRFFPEPIDQIRLETFEQKIKGQKGVKIVLIDISKLKDLK
jgi:hypothetical protein